MLLLPVEEVPKEPGTEASQQAEATGIAVRRPVHAPSSKTQAEVADLKRGLQSLGIGAGDGQGKQCLKIIKDTL